MPGVAELLLKIRADAKDFAGGMKTAEGGLASFTKRATRLGTDLTKYVTLPIMAMGAIGVREFMESENAMAQTEARIKSTGGAAGMTAKEVATLADRVSRLTAIDDENVQAAENMLLSFTKIKKGVGETNNIFERATFAAADLSVAFGTDISDAAKQLGKALNDPEKGMSRLGRVVGQFTDEQKAAVKAMVASGDTMGAQSLILDVLAVKFGGAGEAAGNTAAGKMKIFWHTLENVAAGIVGVFMPVALQLTDWATKLAGWFEKMPAPIKAFISVILGAAAAIGPLLLAGVGVIKMVQAFQGALTLLSANPVVLIVAAIIAALMLLSTHWDTVVKWFKKGWEAIVKAFDWARDRIVDGINLLIRWWNFLLDAIDKALGPFINLPDIPRIGDDAADSLKGLGKAAEDTAGRIDFSTRAVSREYEDMTVRLNANSDLVEESLDDVGEGADEFGGKVKDLNAVVKGSDWAASLQHDLNKTLDGFTKAKDQGTITVEEWMTNMGEKIAQNRRWKEGLAMLERSFPVLAENLRTTGGPELVGVVEGFLGDAATGGTKAFAANMQLVAEVHAEIGRVGEELKAGYAGLFTKAREAGSAVSRGWNAGVGTLTVKAPTTVGGLRGGRARGGPVMAGRVSMVGEEGPELFVSSSPGRIIPNGQAESWMLNNFPPARTLGTSSSGAALVVNISGSVVTERELVSVLRRELERIDRRNN